MATFFSLTRLGKSPKLQRLFRAVGLGILGLLLIGIFSGAGLFFYIRSDAGERWLTAKLNDILALAMQAEGQDLRVGAVRGPLPSVVQLTDITARDRDGLWLQVKEASLRIRWGSLLNGKLDVESLLIAHPELERLPQGANQPHLPEKTTETPEQNALAILNMLDSWPDWLPALSIDKLKVDSLTLGPEITGDEIGKALVLTLTGSAKASPNGVKVDLALNRDDLPGGEHVTLAAELAPHQKLYARLMVAENRNGLLVRFLSPDLAASPAVQISLTGFASTTPSGLQADAFFHFHLTDMAWGNERLALFGPKVDASATLHAECSLPAPSTSAPAHTQLALSSLRLNAGQVSAQGEAWLSIPDGNLSGGTASVDCSVALNDLTGLNLPAITAQGPLALRVTATGPLLAPAAAMEFNCPALTPQLVGEKLTATGLRIRLTSPSLNLMAFAANFTALENAAPGADETMAEGKLEADCRLSDSRLGTPTIDDRGPVTLRMGWNVGKRNKNWHGALTDLEFRGAGLLIAGSMTGIPSPIFPLELNGSLKAEVMDWSTLSAVTGQPLGGAGLGLDVSFTPTPEGQSLQVAWRADRLEWADKRNEARSRRKTRDSEFFFVRGLRGSARLNGVPAAPRVEIRNETGLLNAGGITFGSSNITMAGPLTGPLRVAANVAPPAGRAVREPDILLAARLEALWHPGQVNLNALDINITGKSGKRRGLVLTQSSVIHYGKSTGGLNASPLATFSTSGLNLNISPSGHVELKGSLGSNQLQLQGTVDDLDLAPFQIFMPALPTGKIRAEFSLTGSPSRPAGGLTIQLVDIHFPDSLVPPVSGILTGALERGGILAARLAFTPRDRAALGATAAGANIRVPLFFSADGVPGIAPHGTLQGNLRWVGALGPLWNFLPLADRRLTGSGQINVDLTGTAQSPRLTVEASVKNAEYVDLALGILLKNIQASVSMTDATLIAKKHGGDAQSDGLNERAEPNGMARITLSAGDGLGGTAAVEGTIDLSTLHLDAQGSLNRLKPLRRQDLRISLSGQASVSGPLFSPSVHAAIIVNEGELRLAELPGGGIRTLDISETAAPVPNNGNTEEEPAGNKSAGEASSRKEGGVLDLGITAPNRFFVRGHGLESEWKGLVHARGPILDPSLTGNLTAVRGNFSFLNKNFQLSRGQVSFGGGQPPNPLLDIVMTYQATNIAADVQVTGTASNPEFALASQPSLPQDEIISQIMFGQSAGNLGRFEALQLAGALASLAGFGSSGNEGVLGVARAVLGVDVLRLNSANSPGLGDASLGGTTLEVGKYVRDNIYVGVSQGMNADSTGVVVDVELTPHINLEARSDNTRTELGAQWKYDY